MKFKQTLLATTLALVSTYAVAHTLETTQPLLAKNNPKVQADKDDSEAAQSERKTLEPKLVPERSFAKASFIMSRVLTHLEYEKLPLDHEMSKKIFKSYFEALDPMKVFLLQSDIDKFDQYKIQMGDMIQTGRLEVPFDIFKLYRERVKSRFNYAMSLLDKKQPFDFSKKEEYTADRTKAPWLNTEEEIQDLWRKKVKNDYLRLKLADTKDAEIVEKLKRRYKNNLNQILRSNSEDVAELFLNAYGDSTDPHTSYMSPSTAKNFQVQMSLSVDGIGAVLQKRDEYGMIREVVAGGPAQKNGQLKPGDRIVAVGQGKNGPMEDVVDWRLDEIVKKIRGKRGSTVRIEYIPSEEGIDSKTKIATIVRDQVMMEDQAARLKMLEVDDKDSDGKSTKKKVAVIEIPSFYEDFEAHKERKANFKSITNDVKKIINDLKGKDVAALVLDLRNDGGGSLGETARLSGLFIGADKPVVQVSDAEGRVKVLKTPRDADALWQKPVVVMVNRLSASASEIFAGLIQDYQRGVVVGDRTWGKGTVQTMSDLSDFIQMRGEPNEQLGALKWTIQKFFRVNGSSTQVKGVEPDIVFPSAFNREELGESSYDNAMQWSEIKPAQYKAVLDLDSALSQLKSQHEERADSSDSWKLFKEEQEYSLELSNRKKTSLNYDDRVKERQEMEKKRESFNERRKALGESDVGVFKLDDGLSYGEGDLKKELADEEKRKKNLDTSAREAANIALDMTHLKIFEKGKKNKKD
ncbi:carboxy terminal-processing peptidase [Brackiella oedipodis]|uniref:carboxy terminal-processing peptidase n=1 Tax=Brackiella oedipodis TaxID=124225 RepID=UPI0006868F3B|nr:carboxy terminal-processing peptidase [Brackiella oedipodis]